MKNVLTLALVAATAGSALGNVTITDGAASADFTGLGGPGLTQTGWMVDGTSQLSEQSFAILIDGNVTFFNDLVPDITFVDDGDFDGDNELLFVGYTIGDLIIDFTYTLSGGTAGSGVSSLAEVVDIRTADGAAGPVTFTLFEYANFDLGGTTTDAGVEVIAPGNQVRQNDTGTTTFASETIQTPAANLAIVGDATAVRSAVAAGDLGAFTDPSLLPSSTGPGDLAWAFGWTFTIQTSGVDSTFQLSKVKSVLPTPGAAGLFALGGLAAARRRR